MRRTRPARRPDRRARRGRPARAAGGPRAGRRRRSAAPRGTGRRRPAGTRRTASRASGPSVAPARIIPSDSLRHAAQVNSTNVRSSRLARIRIRSAGTFRPQTAQSTPFSNGGVRSRGSIGRQSTSWPPSAPPVVPDRGRYSQGVSCRATRAIPRPRRHDKEAARGTGRGSSGDRRRHRITSATPTRRTRRASIRRLSRMEGQVRGIARMIEREEYCVDILQQTVGAAGRRRRALDPRPRGPRPGLCPDGRRAGRGRRIRRRGDRRRPSDARPAASAGAADLPDRARPRRRRYFRPARGDRRGMPSGSRAPRR